MNFEALRKMLESAAKGSNQAHPKIWRPSERSTAVRIVPYPHNPDNPFSTGNVYFSLPGTDRRYIVSKSTFGEMDKIASAINMVLKGIDYDSNKELWRSVAKLRPSTRFYVPVIVRGSENKGIVYWDMAKTTFSMLGELIVQAGEQGAAPINDPKEGRDIIITKNKSKNDKFAKITVSIALQPSPIATDNTFLQTLNAELQSLPPIENILRELVLSDEDEEYILERGVMPYLRQLIDGGNSYGFDYNVSSQESRESISTKTDLLGNVKSVPKAPQPATPQPATPQPANPQPETLSPDSVDDSIDTDSNAPDLEQLFQKFFK